MKLYEYVNHIQFLPEDQVWHHTDDLLQDPFEILDIPIQDIQIFTKELTKREWTIAPYILQSLN